MHFKWKYVPPTSDELRLAGELSEKLNMSPLLTQLLVKRGITTESAAKQFFKPQLADLINPFRMKDMDAAVKVIGIPADENDAPIVKVSKDCVDSIHVWPMASVWK